MSHGWARVIIDLAVPYDSDVEEIEEKILAVATELAGSPKWRYRIIEKPALWGIESISAEAIIVRLVIKTRASAKDDVARELRLRLKKALDDMGVRLPSLISVIPTGAASTVGLRSSKSQRAKTLTIGGEPEPASAPKPAGRASRPSKTNSDGSPS
jgi:small conductance mechanosensitive channel